MARRTGASSNGGGREGEGRRGETRPALHLSWWKRILFTLAPLVALLILLEVVLGALGVRPGLEQEDPFVGFASNVPLFVESAADGGGTMVTATNKVGLFNEQRFARVKPAGTYRIFTLGGSTTYGRPYFDETSFSGWLRELLPLARPGTRWEVINAGGISYASYRVARVVEEIIDYEPDLVVIYTGHNEFLEERSYGELRDMPSLVRRAMATLARSRTWTAARSMIRSIASDGPGSADERSVLPLEVQARLDTSGGPEIYHRDDPLAERVLAHFRFSLERMVDLAQSVGARVVLVSPASSLKDCTPFRSEPTDGLTPEQEMASTRALAQSRELLSIGDAEAALTVAESAVATDPRSADLLYARGLALLTLERHNPAREALISARDEDVCPLRALSRTQAVVREVSRDREVTLVDFPAILDARMIREHGHAIPGREYFLDHVHPTIEGHRVLATAIVESLIEEGVVSPGPDWNESAIAALARRVEEGLDPDLHARGLANLALVFDWAGKKEESQRLAMRALESGVEDATILMIAARHLALSGEPDRARELFQRAVRVEPGAPVALSQFALFLVGQNELAAAAAHAYLASLIWAQNETYQLQLAQVLVMRNRPDVAMAALAEGLRVNPGSVRLRDRLSGLCREHEVPMSSVRPSGFQVDRFESGYPHHIAQTRTDPTTGETHVHGLWTEWRDGGGLRAVADYVDGVRQGKPIIWTDDGRERD